MLWERWNILMFKMRRFTIVLLGNQMSEGSNFSFGSDDFVNTQASLRTSCRQDGVSISLLWYLHRHSRSIVAA